MGVVLLSCYKVIHISLIKRSLYLQIDDKKTSKFELKTFKNQKTHKY